VFLGPFVAVAGMVLAALSFGTLAVVVQLLATLLKHAGI
jgi:hypothetical protein